MHLLRLQSFVSELRGDPDVSKVCSETTVYYLAGERWLDSDNDAPVDAALLQHIARVDRAGNSQESGKLVFFSVRRFRAVVRLKFPAVPQQKKRQLFEQYVERCARMAENAFDAHHDSLTGLLNQRGLGASVQALLATNPGTRVAGNSAPGVEQTSASTHAIALDLDHFKQVNDTFGHLYGDVVLRSFSQRLAVAAEKTQANTPGSRLLVARTGGEEFVVIASGFPDDESVSRFVELVQKAVADTPLPSDSEWELDREKVGALPHQSDRRVTVSIGMSSAVLPRSLPAIDFIARLKDEADAALYRAKAAGRNTWRSFADILLRGGRVLEHHADTHIVAIDIGKQARVRAGQEFLVYHPDFFGMTPFVNADGRSKRRLGTYPKVSSGRVIVFDSQPEMAFCHVAEESKGVRFPAGAVLEAIPLGSISHLLALPTTRNALQGQNLEAPESMPPIIARLADGGLGFSVAVFSLDDVDTLEERRGGAFINEALVGAYGALCEVFPPNVALAQLQSTQFAAVMSQSSEKEVRKTIEEVLNRISANTHHNAKFGAGVFVHQPTITLPGASPHGKGATGSLIENDPNTGLSSGKGALDFARYAASQEARAGRPVEFFAAATASRIVAASRAAKLYPKAIADYLALTALGVDNSNLANLAVACSLEMSPARGDVAISASARAVALAPTMKAYWLNRGLAEFCFVDRQKSYASFLRGDTFELLHCATVYKVPYALAMYAQYKDDNKSVDMGELLACLRNANGGTLLWLSFRFGGSAAARGPVAS